MRKLHLSSTTADPPTAEDVSSSVTSIKVTADPPSWDDLSSAIDTLHNNKGAEDDETPQLTLYRDTNGWCPFCERVWVAVRAKGIPYRERLISLQDKPEWYKELVPTTLVPAILLHPTMAEEEEDTQTDTTKPKNERTLVWESADILQALDDAFPSTPRLLHPDNPDFTSAMTEAEELVTAGFYYIFGGRNASLTEEDVADRRTAFLDKLDTLDSSINAQTTTTTTEPSFRLGNEFTAVDAVLIPVLERWRFQLPLTHSIDILHNRPHLQKWFDTVDSYAPYADRVAGDEYSWTSVTSVFQRYFADTEDPKVKEVMQRADEAAEGLTSSFTTAARSIEDDGGARLEAAAKLVSNHAAVIQDCTSGTPAKSQTDLERASDVDAADVVLRYIVSILLSDEGSGGAMGTMAQAPLVRMEGGGGEGAMAKAVRVVAARVCVPRDMGRGAAVVLRGVLAGVADRLEE